MRYFSSAPDTDLVLDIVEHSEDGKLALVDAVACVRRHPSVIPKDWMPLDVLRSLELNGIITVDTKEGKIYVE